MDAEPAADETPSQVITAPPLILYPAIPRLGERPPYRCPGRESIRATLSLPPSMHRIGYGLGELIHSEGKTANDMNLLIKALCAIAAVIAVAGIVCMAVLEGEGGQPNLPGLLLLVIGIVVGMPTLIFGASSPRGREGLDKLSARVRGNRGKMNRKKIRRLNKISKYSLISLTLVGFVLFLGGLAIRSRGAMAAGFVLFGVMFVCAQIIMMVVRLGGGSGFTGWSKTSEKEKKLLEALGYMFIFLFLGAIVLTLGLMILCVLALVIAIPLEFWEEWTSGKNLGGMVAYILSVVGCGSFLIWRSRSDKQNKKKAPRVRVFALAKELDMTSKELISFLKTEGHKVSSHMSSIDESAAKALRERLKPKAGETPAEKPGKKAG